MSILFCLCGFKAMLAVIVVVIQGSVASRPVI